MAHFKLELLTPVLTENSDTSFLTNVITDFSSQLDTNQLHNDMLLEHSSPSFAFSFDEKLNIHTNADKELTFSMHKKVWIGSEWMDNPYALALQVGSQLVLTDKDNREHLFIVKQIQYNCSDINTIYQYSCQDLFNYQLTRQNDGYTINNDPSTAEFIGAKTADWWIVNKILPDCYIHYNYIPTCLGAYINADNILKQFQANLLNNDVRLPSLDNITDLVEICKPVYTDVMMQETIPFASSGSAAAILKSLAAEIGCNIQVWEKRYFVTNSKSSPIKFQLYFWLEPIKNDRYSGLTYSPHSNVQSMNLTLSGDALTTALTINSHTIGDEEITLFPAVPGFFSTLFNTSELWNTQHPYYTGMFTDLINGQTYHQEFHSAFRTTLSTPPDFLQQITTLAGTEWEWRSFIPGCPARRYNCDFSTTDENDNIINCVQLQMGDKQFIYQTIDGAFTAFNLPDDWESDNYRRLTFGNTGRDLKNTQLIQFLNLWAVCLSNHWYGVKLDVELNHHYPYVTFEYDNHISRYFSITNRSNLLYLYITWTLNGQQQIMVVAEGEQIDFSRLKTSDNEPITNYECYLATPSNEFAPEGFVDCYIKFYRDYTEEEYEFAQIADACPWLENKLYDFSYFVQSNILSQEEYQELWNLLTNDLRIINGQLMSYGTTYLDAMQSRIKHISQLENELDLLGATFQADIIGPYQTTGKLAGSLDKVRNLYNQFFSKTSEHQPLHSLLNYNESLEDVWTKYLNAEQRFLKNIYQFEQYFNAPCGFNTHNLRTFKLSWEIPTLEANQIIHYLSFANKTFAPAWNVENNIKKLSPLAYSGDQPATLLFTLYNKTYVPYNIIHDLNYHNYRIATVHTGDFVEIQNNHTFNEKNTYYITLEDYATIFKQNVTTLSSKNDPRIVTLDSQTLIRLTERELMTVFLCCHPDTYQVHLPSHYIPFDWIRYRIDDTDLDAFDSSQPIKDATTKAAKKIFQSINPYFLNPPTEKNPTNDDGTDNLDWWDYSWNWYKYSLPISSLYWYGPVYTQKNDEYQQVNNYYQTQSEFNSLTADELAAYPNAVDPTDYAEYQLVSFISGLPSGSEEVAGLSLEDYINYVNKTESEFSYYALTRHGNWGAFGAIGGAAALTGSGLLIGAAAAKMAVAGAAMAAIPIAGWICLGAGLLVTLALGLGLGLSTDEWNCSWVNTYDAFRYFSPYWKDNAWHHGLIGNKDDINNYYQNEIKEVFVRSALSSTDYTWYENQHWRDSYYAIYAKAADSAFTNTTLTDAPHGNTNPSSISWQYYNYYSLIAATYSLDLKATNTTPSALYINHHTYYRPVRFTEPLNRTTKYHQLVLNMNDVSKTDLLNNRSQWLMFNDPDCYPRFDKVTQGKKEDLSALPKFNDIQFANFLLYLEALNLDGLQPHQWQEGMSLQDVYGVLDLGNVVELFTEEELEDSLLADYIYCFESRSEGKTVYFAMLLLEEQPYDVAIIDNQPSCLGWQAGSWNHFHVNPLDAKCDPYTIYTKETNIPVSLHKSSTNIFADTWEFTENNEKQTIKLWYQATEAENFREISDVDWSRYVQSELDSDQSPLDYWFYHIDAEGEAQRIYTIRQLQALPEAEKPILYLLNHLSTEQLVYSDSSELMFQLPLYLHTLETNEQGLIIVNTATMDPTDHIIKISYSGDEVTQEESVTDNNIIYTSHIKVSLVDNFAVAHMSNGFFWYSFHENTAQPLLQEHASVIETQLTNYWTQAVGASKSCRFFLPDTWTLRQDTDRNFFASQILTPVYVTTATDEETKTTVSNVVLNHTYIPRVEIVKAYYQGQYTHLLPKYQWTYQTPNIKADSTNQKLVNSNNYQLAWIATQHNDGIIQVANHLKNPSQSIENFLSEWTVEEIGKQVYYTCRSGGMEWKDIAFYLSKKDHFNRYDGWYGLYFYALKHFYVSRELTTYHDLLMAKQQKQQQIYHRFPGILLEGTYTNDKATTSAELLRLAKLAFRDQRRPERGYTLTIHDLASLQGYHGQSLRIGDPIRLHALEYYDTLVNVSDALNQYLFISDISYNLRSDTSISITVNSIKYQDKVMQRIVRLIQ